MQQRKFSASISLVAGRPADAIYTALKPDLASKEMHVSTSITLEGREIRMELSSDDLSHFRAALNSYLRLAGAASSCLDVAL